MEKTLIVWNIVYYLQWINSIISKVKKGMAKCKSPEPKPDWETGSNSPPTCIALDKNTGLSGRSIGM